MGLDVLLDQLIWSLCGAKQLGFYKIKQEQLPAVVVQAQHGSFYPVGRIHLEVNGISFGLLPPLQPQVSGW